MILSHRHRFIFFAVPKTGTHSVRRALRAHLGAEDQEQVGLFERKALPYPELAAIRHGHISAREAQPVLGPDVFGGYFKFAFVRNPFDRFVSYCAFISRDSGEFHAAPGAFMRRILREASPQQAPLFRAQHEFLVDAEGRLAMDQIGRTEEMQDAYAAICRRLELPAIALDRVNSSTHRDFREYYDAELVERVSDVYRRDLDLFGYRFE